MKQGQYENYAPCPTTIVTNGEKMNLQVGGPTNTIVLTENRTGVTLIMDLTLYQLGHASTTKT